MSGLESSGVKIGGNRAKVGLGVPEEQVIHFGCVEKLGKGNKQWFVQRKQKRGRGKNVHLSGLQALFNVIEIIGEGFTSFFIRRTSKYPVNGGVRGVAVAAQRGIAFKKSEEMLIGGSIS
jgi:hypothetical protein